MNSRERLLAAIECGEPDYVPLSFMIFRALETRCRDWFDRIDTEIALGLDTVGDLARLTPLDPTDHGDAREVPLRFGRDIRVRQWRGEVGSFRWVARTSPSFQRVGSCFRNSERLFESGEAPSVAPSAPFKAATACCSSRIACSNRTGSREARCSRSSCFVFSSTLSLLKSRSQGAAGGK